MKRKRAAKLDSNIETLIIKEWTTRKLNSITEIAKSLKLPHHAVNTTINNYLSTKVISNE